MLMTEESHRNPSQKKRPAGSVIGEPQHATQLASGCYEEIESGEEQSVRSAIASKHQPGEDQRKIRKPSSSALLNIAERRQTRIGPQYQAEVPDWVPSRAKQERPAAESADACVIKPPSEVAAGAASTKS